MSRHPPPRGRRKPRPARSRSTAGRAELELTAIGLGTGGEGVAETAGGGRVFVPFAAPGDRVRARLPPADDPQAAADFLELVAAGPLRAVPPCPHFGPCGGCRVQHLAEGAYRDWKRDLVRRALARRDLAPPVAAPIVSPPHSRRRVTLAARRSGGRVLLGFNEHRSHRIVDLQTCVIADPAIVALLPALRTLLAGLLAEGEAADVALTVLEDGIDMVLVGATPPGLAAREALAGFAATADLARLSWRPGAGGGAGGGKDGGAAAEPIAHRRPGIVRFGGIAVTLPPGGFLQATREGEAALQDLVAAAIVTLPATRPATLPGRPRIADLFAGAGTFALPLAARAAHLLAVDGDAAALDALAAAARHRFAHLATARRDLARDPVTAAELRAFDAVIFDPPRAGAAAQAAEIAASPVPLVVAVACNPVTLARDLQILAQGGYAIEQVTPVDQFLWSPHIEAVAVARRPG